MGGNDAFAADFFLKQDLLMRVLSHCSLRSCCQMVAVNRSMHSLCQDDVFYEALCCVLRKDFKVYVPITKCTDIKWRDVFFESYAFRSIFGLAMPDQTSTVFQISVGARFKPMNCLGSQLPGEDVPKMVLPLHQRLQLIRSQNGCDVSEARRLLWNPSGQTADPWADSQLDDDAGHTKKIHSRENATSTEATDAADGTTTATDAFHPCVLAVHPGAPGSVLFCAPGVGLRPFDFSTVFGEAAGQEHVYSASVQRLVSSFLNGRNACVMAYGQTGSGKTHTMFGPPSGEALGESGVVPRAVAEVMTGVEEKVAAGVECRLSVTYVEIFGEQVTDLLRDGGVAVGAWHGVAHRAVLEGQCEVDIPLPPPPSSSSSRAAATGGIGDAAAEAAGGGGGLGTLAEHLRAAEERKRRAATAMNERSSRAHAVLILRLRQRLSPAAAAEGGEDTGEEVESTMCFADLGGSEQVLKSKVASCATAAGGYLAMGERMQEAVNINLGLLALRGCIKALAEGDPHVPYGDSRLTQTLAGALGGRCRSLVLVTASLDRRNALETLNSLRFGESCGLVTNTDMDRGAAATRALRAIDQEIAQVEEAIRSKERWVTQKVVRRDLLHQEDEATGADEVVTKSLLVGAEEERDRLQALLDRRRILVGPSPALSTRTAIPPPAQSAVEAL